MKKQTIIVGVVILLLLIGGGFYLATKNKPAAQTVHEGSAQSTQQKTSAFSSIADALSKSLSLTCDFTDDQGRHIISNIKAGAVRADITTNSIQDSGSMIMKDKTIYYWNGKQGFMMTVPDVTVSPAPQGSQSTENKGEATQQDIMGSLEKFKQYCKPAVVSDSLFTPPSDVTFTDYSKMMVPPATNSGSSGANPQPSIDYQKMIQQYQQGKPQG